MSGCTTDRMQQQSISYLTAAAALTSGGSMRSQTDAAVRRTAALLPGLGVGDLPRECTDNPWLADYVYRSTMRGGTPDTTSTSWFGSAGCWANPGSLQGPVHRGHLPGSDTARRPVELPSSPCQGFGLATGLARTNDRVVVEHPHRRHPLGGSQLRMLTAGGWPHAGRRVEACEEGRSEPRGNALSFNV
jgi:hypothetical protein